MNSTTFTFNIKAVSDMKDVLSNIENIQSALNKLKLPEGMKASFDKTFKDLTKEVENYQTILNKPNKTKGDITGLERSSAKIITLYDKIAQKIKSIDNTTLKNAFKDLGAEQVKQLKEEVTSLQEKLASTAKSSKFAEGLQTNFNNLKEKIKGTSKDVEDLVKKFGNQSFGKTFLNNIDTGRLDLAEKTIARMRDQVNKLDDSVKGKTAVIEWLDSLNDGLKDLEKEESIQNIVKELEEAKQKLSGSEANIINGLIKGFREGTLEVDKFGNVIVKTTGDLNGLNASQQQFNSELDQLKSRIQYFFGLNNAIQLVKRTIRSAFQTIQELDKAMTATAVVTDFTVGDMWSQLPEYTKRANELGVSTKAAYEAATLYYQQGLNTEQVMAMSNETLKMARIAGLEAADATDRMTNAIRGFNMEINQMNAERVNDVYSKLAAISASNVDEISTAMTKVASLAHNAGMEFETTAAFLAQIIETTRESAETAGTALKTVVARFSEVKKLVSADQIKGQDEEGQLIDVNKVSAALRTAGIDLNKYFLGEVGLDDIFMELASKWDSLTSIQQRYIATQAAGSRQQSRFIAMMQDYARTQELVGAAYNSNGAAAKQFAKTQESLESKLARLKNAWNEFAMGILNSDVTKLFVDGLTKILNGINALTSGFGTLNQGIGGVIGSLLKLAALMGSLKLGGALIKATAGSALSTVTGGKSGGTFGEIFKASMAGGTLKQIGAGLWGGAQKIGINKIGKGGIGSLIPKGVDKLATKMGAVPELAAGLAGVGTILAALAAAALAAQGIYELWLNFSTKGRLKKATEEAKKLQEDADKAESELKSLKSLQDTYKEKTSEVTSATTVEDRQAAIQERNESILNAIKEDGTLAQYVVTEQIDDQIVLTLNEKALADAASEAAKIAAQAAIDAYFGTARQSLREAEDYENELDKLASRVYDTSEISPINYQKAGERWWEGYTWKENGQFEYIKQFGTDEQKARAIELSQLIAAAKGTAQTNASLAYGETLKRLETDADITNLLLPILAEAYKENEKTLSDEVLKSIASNEAYLPILEAYSGKGQLSSLNLLGKDIGGIGFIESLSIASDELEKLSKEIGLSSSEIEEHIRNQAKQNKDIQKANAAKIYQNLYDSQEKIDYSVQSLIESLSPERMAQIANIGSQAKELLSPEQYAKLNISDLFTSTNLDEIQNLLDSINLDNPISAFLKLEEAEKGASDEVKTYINAIRESNTELLSATGLVQSFIISSSYDDITDSLNDFIEANRRITSKNIEELAESNKELDNLLKTNKVNAEGLANALTLIQEGTITFDNLTDAMLAALSVGESFEDLISNTHTWIEEFNAGTDLTEGTEFITKQIEEAMKYVSDWQFGNEPLENIYNHFFGENAYRDFMREHQDLGFDQIEKLLTEQLNNLSSLAEDEGLGALQKLSGSLGIQQIKDNEFIWDLSNFESTADAISAVADALGVTNEAAAAFIEGWGSHMYDLREAWNDLQYREQIEAFADSVKDGRVVTEQELIALGKIVGKTTDEVYRDLNRFNKGINIRVNWIGPDGTPLTGEELLKQFNNTFGETPDKKYGFDASGIQDKFINYKDFIKDISERHPIGGIIYDEIDASALYEKLISTGLSSSQAKEVGNNIVSSINNALLTKTIKIPKYEFDDDGNIISATMEDVTVTGHTFDEVEAATEARLAQVDASAVGTSVASSLAKADYSGFMKNLAKAVAEAVSQGAQQGLENTNFPSGGGKDSSGKKDFSGLSGKIVANGGIVGSYASGSRKIKPGIALTGEEAPEIVWNKQKGYAYITGAHGPQFQNLQSGDRVFNGTDTKNILQNQGTEKLFGSYVNTSPASKREQLEYLFSTGASSEAIKQTAKSISVAAGAWKTGPSAPSGGGSDKKTSDEWKNELDWLYDLMEDIAEEEHQQTLIQSKYELTLKDLTKTGKDLYDLTKEELSSLTTQLDAQNIAYMKRLQQMNELQQLVNEKGFQTYLQWNPNDQTLEIDWDAIEAITDKDTYDQLNDLISKMEKVQDQMDDAQKSVLDIKKQIQDLQSRYLQAYLDFQNRVLDAVVKSYQDNIDQLSDLNSTLSDTNSSILESIQKEIDLQRQIRDNTETESNIKDLETRLSYLQRDTTGANAQEIRDLQKQLDEAREGYADTLIDQAITKLSESNDEAAKQRDHQISIMQSQLDYWKDSGMLWAEVGELISTGFSPEGTIIEDSALWSLLQSADSWNALSEAQKKNWANELITSSNEVGAHLIQISGGMEVDTQKVQDSISNIGGILTQDIGVKLEQVRAILAETGTLGGTPAHSTHEIGFASGGLSTKTGFALLHGTTSEPEYVLNARQTDAFLRLADILPAALGNNAITNNLGSNIYVDLTMNVGEISSDYDVDRIVDRVKTDIYAASTYRNVNAVSFQR